MVVEPPPSTRYRRIRLDSATLPRWLIGLAAVLLIVLAVPFALIILAAALAIAAAVALAIATARLVRKFSAGPAAPRDGVIDVEYTVIEDGHDRRGDRDRPARRD